MKIIVYYYSKTGNNRYIANKIAEELSCDIEEIKPKLNHFLFNMFIGTFGIKALKKDVNDYDLAILCGPIWMGKLIYPLKNFIEKNNKKINKIVFATCCASSYDKKDDKFGHTKVFAVVQDKLQDKCIHYEAFPIPLIVADELKENGQEIMKTRLSDENFEGEIKEVFDSLIECIQKIKKSKSPEMLNTNLTYK